MAEIKAFRGLLYNPEKVGDLSQVMAPPYDVISPERQDDLYSRHPFNVIRLILSKENPGDSPENDRYTRAASDFKKWARDSTLLRDDRPSIYYYAQTYSIKDSARHTRKGFIALSRIEDFGKGRIHAHEQTLSGPKADRLRLMKACNANMSCIFSLYSDPKLSINRLLEESIAGTLPLIDVTDDDGIKNRLWRIDDQALVEKVTAAMEGRQLFIADGHHRYETALNYRNLMRDSNPRYTGSEPYNYVMMYFSNMDDEGMTILPTHRIIHSLAGFDGDAFLKECRNYFDIEEFAYTTANEVMVKLHFMRRMDKSEKEDRTAFGLHIKGVDTYYVLLLKSPGVMDKAFGPSIPEVFKKLDVTVLHSLILSKILGMTRESQERQENLVYVKSSEAALEAMKDEKNQLVFLLRPTKIEEVKAVALAGQVMPQKSTYFYPKLLSGLVFNLLDEKSFEAEPVKL